MENRNRGMNTFFWILSACLICILLVNVDRAYSLTEYNPITTKGIVIEKRDSFIIGKILYVKDSYNDVHQVSVWDIDYNIYNIGDTIK